MKRALIQTAVILAALATTTLDAATWKCRVTGKTSSKCCCELQNGKFTCGLTKQKYDKCCCETDAKAASLNGFPRQGLPRR